MSNPAAYAKVVATRYVPLEQPQLSGAIARNFFCVTNFCLFAYSSGTCRACREGEKPKDRLRADHAIVKRNRAQKEDRLDGGSR